MRKCYFLLSFLIGIIFNLSTLWAQTGVPLIKNYISKEIESDKEIYSVIQDKRGLMYFGSKKGVLEYDGTNWRVIPLPGNIAARTIALSDSGIIYVGGMNEMGYLAPDAGGKLAFVSLRKKISSSTNKSQTEIGEIEKINILNQSIYFASKEKLFLWDKKTIQECVLTATTKNFTTTKNLIIHPQWGLVNVEGIKAKRLAINYNTRIKNKFNNIVALETFGNNRKLLATQTALLVMDGRGLTRPYRTQAQYYLTKNIIADLKVLQDGRITIATLRGGVVVVNPQGGRLEYIINHRGGLQDETVHNLCVDHQGGLWMALEDGVARAEVASAVRKFEDKLGLKGAVNAVTYYDNTMYVGTERGLFYLNTKESPAVFRAVNGIIANTFSLVANKRALFAATSAGVYKIEEDTAEVVLNVPATYLARTRTNADEILVGLTDGLGYIKTKAKKSVLVKVENGKPKYKKIEEIKFYRIDSLKDAVTAIETDRNGRVWLATSEGIVRLHFKKGLDSLPEIQRIKKGLPDGDYKLITAKGDVKVCTDEGIYRYDIRNGFIPDSTLGIEWLKQPIRFCYETNQGDVLLGTKSGIVFGRQNIETKAYEWDYNTFVRYGKLDASTVLVGGARKDPVYWIGHTDGLLRFEPRLRREKAVEYYTLIRKTTATFANAEGKRVLFFGTQASTRMNRKDTTQHYQAELRELEKIRFDFAALSFDDEENNRYQYRLLGLDSTWSEWSSVNHVEFSAIPFGNYVFQVRASNIYGVTGKIAEYAFMVKPLWYQTPWARAGFMLSGLMGFGALFVGGVRFYSYRLQVANRKLEAKIAEATYEIRNQNLQLAAFNTEIVRQKEIIEEKNKHITDSILYAKRIQEAILPKHEQIKKVLPNYFILFKPRDQVSGDFYWFTEINGYTVLAAGDCTGHGVPGALMSMIGSSLLNKIVNENEITQPNTILEHLHQGIHISLRQYEENSNSNIRDGIDICISKIDFKVRSLEVASANRPIYWVQKGELCEITGDKYSVGGPAPSLSFKNHCLTFEPGDTLYMFSDGYVDQFGGANYKKFQTRRFRELLLANQQLPLDEQCSILERELEEWKGSTEQVDDILVVGIRF